MKGSSSINFNDELPVEVKGLLDSIINNVSEIFTLTPFRGQINDFMRGEYRKGMAKLEGQIKPHINFIPPSDNQRTMENLYNYTYQNLQNVADEVGNKLRQNLQRGLLEGNNIDGVKKIVKETLKDTKVTERLKVVIRTEQARANAMGTYEGAQQAQEAGIKLRKWLDVTMDNRSSHICDKDNNPNNAKNKYGDPKKAIPIDEEFVLKYKQGNKTVTLRQQFPPFHPNCRTVLRIVRER